MRKAWSARAKDRPQIPDTVHPILGELISRSWQPSLAKRPPMYMIWQRMREVDFQFVSLCFCCFHSTGVLDQKLLTSLIAILGHDNFWLLIILTLHG
jgi:hypothetical protein